MAKKKAVGTVVLMGGDLLKALAVESLKGDATYLLTTLEQRNSMDASMWATNPAITGPNGELATRANQAGIAASGVATQPAANKYAILDNIELPEVKRGNFGGGRKPSEYPFDTLGVKQGFFVLATAEHPNPAKTLASTVSGASKRYSKEIPGEFVTRNVTNEAGVSVPTQFPKRSYERKFEIRKIEDGTAYGYPPINGKPQPGALIARVI